MRLQRNGSPGLLRYNPPMKRPAGRGIKIFKVRFCSLGNFGMKQALLFGFVRIIAVLFLCAAETVSAQDRPNIIWMIADDIGYDLKSYRNPLAKTPAIDSLARKGVRFWRFYTPSSVCSPSRVGFSTGQNPAELGVYTTLHPNMGTNAEYNGVGGIADGVPTVFEILSSHGYLTGHAGKWHRGSIQGFGPADKGVSKSFSFAAVGSIPAKLKTLFAEGPQPYYSQVDDRITDWSIEFIEQATQPFFLEISFHTPHTPLHPPQKYLDEFSNLGGDQAASHVGMVPRPVTPAQVYYASIKQMDDNVGRILETLKAKGLENNTIIMFFGDNGPGTQRSPQSSFNAFGSTGPFRGNKATVYEGGLRVPFIASGPGFAKNAEIYGAISGTDLVPSLLSIIGINIDTEFYGEDMSAMFFGNDIRRSKPIHWITIQSRPQTESVANRSPVLAMYDPESGIKCLMQPSRSRLEAYRTELSADPAELVNLELTSPELAHSCFDSLEDWFERLPPPKKFRKDAGKLYVFH